MLRVVRDELFALRHLEVGEVEAGGYGAADERVRIWIEQRGAEPAAGGDDGLEVFAVRGVAAEKKLLIVAVGVMTCTLRVEPA